MDLDAVAVELYGLTPDEFTAARNHLAKTVGGSTGTAIKALRRPTLAAWLANLLVRTDPDGINTLTELGEQLRTAHLSADGARLRALTPKRHQLVKSLVATARAEAQQLGRPPTQTVMDRLTETLDAALIDPGAAQLLRSGQLTSALRHVGFGVVDETGSPAKLAPLKPRAVRSTPAKKAAKTAPKRRPAGPDPALQRRKAELEARAKEVDAEYREAEKQRVAAESLLDAHQHQVQDLHAATERLTEELDHARQQLKTTQRETARLERALDRATRAAELAKRRRDSHQQRLADLAT
ncbi:hypothetical protein [Kribbella sp. CA-294648]|uniref:hypothetical protein n=1 Tax=Kribbella sp. CA-294648 TaxID=3239948 RepID=UPI003D939CA3